MVGKGGLAMRPPHDHQEWDMPAQRGGRRNCADSGASMVEFAIIAPVLLILLFGIFELARLGYAFSEVWTSAREGARYATTTGDSDSPGDGIPNFVDCSGIEEAALSKVVVEGLTGADVDITYYDSSGAEIANCQGGTDPASAGNIDTGTAIKVSVTASFDSVVPLIEPFFDGIVLDNEQSRTVNYGNVGT
jgi:Flp pilus assembly protein TadG